MKKLFLAMLTFISTQAMAQTLEKCNGSMNQSSGE